MSLYCVWVVLSVKSDKATLACASGTAAIDIARDITTIAARPEIFSSKLEQSKLLLEFRNYASANSFMKWLNESQPNVDVPSGYQPVQATILWPELPGSRS